MAAHLPRDLVRPSSVLQQLAQTMKETVFYGPRVMRFLLFKIWNCAHCPRSFTSQSKVSEMATHFLNSQAIVQVAFLSDLIVMNKDTNRSVVFNCFFIDAI